jgi:transcriptional regulator with XRE-family HTH domain
MNAIEKIYEDLKREGLDARLDPPKNPDATWWLDIRGENQHIEVTWKPGRGFGISTLGADGFGEGADEVYWTREELFSRLHALLKTGEKTTRPRECTLGQLREIQGLSQQQIAARLGVQQAAVSKMERREDMLLQTLRRYIEELGGRLDISVNLSGETIRLVPFSSHRSDDSSPPAYRRPRLPPPSAGTSRRMKFLEVRAYRSPTVLRCIEVSVEQEGWEKTPAEGSAEPLLQRHPQSILSGEHHGLRLHDPARCLSLHRFLLRGSLHSDQATHLPRGSPAPLVSMGPHLAFELSSERPHRGGSLSPTILRGRKAALYR